MTKFTWKNIEKDKWVYSSYRITFDIKDSWNFGNDIKENFVIFGIDNSSSYRSDNGKNNCLLSGEGPTSDLHGILGYSEKAFRINFSKGNTNFCLRLHYNGNNSNLFVDKKRSISLNLAIKMLTLWLNFV